jgi:hypothetical protein
LVTAISSCKKDSSSEICYQCKDMNGAPLHKICGSSEDDAYEQAEGSQINGVTITSKAYFLANCPRE